MAVCTYCDQDMVAGVGCTLTHCEGEPARVPNGERTCHDCGCPPGTLHHPGCDAERCPMCGGQAGSCMCGVYGEWGGA